MYGFISALGASSLGLTLDLSGVTGLIVSVGITVDSYVVYFERLKDEVRAGRSVRAAVERGFRSAYRTILSADAVSFIGALVLWLLSVGAVRGFAFMLGLSTLVDVVTAYVFTRPLVILLGRNAIATESRRSRCGTRPRGNWPRMTELVSPDRDPARARRGRDNEPESSR